MPKNLDHTILDSMYRNADSLDNRHFQKLMSYERLIQGDHFYQSMQKQIRTSRTWEGSSPKARLRLVQNHLARWHNYWMNGIINQASDVEPMPKNDNELKDRKAAELNKSVKSHIAEETDFFSVRDRLVGDYLKGECAVRIGFNPDQGSLVPGEIEQAMDENGQPAMEPYVDPTTGQPIIDPMTGQPQMRPVFIQPLMPSGIMTIEAVEMENLLRDPMARSWNEARWVCHRKTRDKKDIIKLAKQLVDNPEALQEMVNKLSEEDETLSAYKGTDNNYMIEESDKKVSVREFFWRPSIEYPNGYYVMCTSSFTIMESELPAGEFPFEFENFDNVQGTPRGASRLKQLAPIQLEINRCVSKIAEHQITVGDDKLVTQAGSKIAEVNKYDGIRIFKVTGGFAPQFLQGRSGDQYVDFWLNNVSMLEKIGEMSEISEDKMVGMEPYAIFFLSSKQKMKFARHASKFERFLVRLWKKVLRIHKYHVHPNAVIEMVGSPEKVNIDEYKSTTDIDFQIKLKPRTEDPDSLIAQQHSLETLLQYAGGNLNEADIGMIAKYSPFIQKTDMVLDSTLKADRATNMILKLDKGANMPISMSDDPDYMLRRLSSRMSMADFDDITFRQQDGQVVPTDIIHQLYQAKIAEYENMIAEREQKALAMQRDMIPTTGGLIPIQMYEAVPSQDGSVSSKRIQLPNDALEWLIQALKTQGMTESTIANLPGGVAADVQGMIAQGNNNQ